MKHVSNTPKTTEKARQTAFLAATVFYALLTMGQLGAIVEGLVGIVPGLALCILWAFGAAGCCRAGSERRA